jgi:hypothetical protein
VLAEVSELTGQNQALNKQFMALAGERRNLACCLACADIVFIDPTWALLHRLAACMCVLFVLQLLVPCACCSAQHSSPAS